MSIDNKTIETESSTAKKRILIVDDEPAIRSTLAMLCGHYGHEVDTAEDGAQGLELYKQGGYNLILTDNDMRGMTGWDMMAEIKKNGNGVPVVLMSGRHIDIEKARNQGFAHYEPKPFGMSRVYEMIVEFAK